MSCLFTSTCYLNALIVLTESVTLNVLSNVLSPSSPDLVKANSFFRLMPDLDVNTRMVEAASLGLSLSFLLDSMKANDDENKKLRFSPVLINGEEVRPKNHACCDEIDRPKIKNVNKETIQRDLSEVEAEQKALEEAIKNARERDRRTLLRALNKGKSQNASKDLNDEGNKAGESSPAASVEDHDEETRDDDEERMKKTVVKKMMKKAKIEVEGNLQIISARI